MKSSAINSEIKSQESPDIIQNETKYLGDDSKIEDNILKNYSQVLNELYKIWDEFQPMNLFFDHPTCETVTSWDTACPYGLTIENQIALFSYLSALIQITLDVIDSLNHCELIIMTKPPVHEQKSFDDIEIGSIPVTSNLVLIRTGNSLYFANKMNDQCEKITENLDTFDRIVELNNINSYSLNHIISLSKDQVEKINGLKLNGLPILKPLIKERNSLWKPLLFRDYRGKAIDYIFKPNENRYIDITSFEVTIKSSTTEQKMSLMLHAENHQCEIIKRKDGKEQVRNIYNAQERANFLHNFFLNLFITHFKKIKQLIAETQEQKNSHIDLMNTFASKLRETSRGQCMEARTASAFEYVEKLHFTRITFNELIYPWLEHYQTQTKEEDLSYLSCLAHLIENIWNEPFEQEKKEKESHCKEKGIINTQLYPIIARCIRELGIEFKIDYHTVAAKLSSPQKKIDFFSCLLKEPYFLQAIGINALTEKNEPTWHADHLNLMGYDKNKLQDTDLDPETKLSTYDQEKNIENLTSLLTTIKNPHFLDIIHYAKQSGNSDLVVKKILDAISKDHLIEIIKNIRAPWILERELSEIINRKFVDDPLWSKIYRNLILYREDNSQLIHHYDELSKQFTNIKSYYQLIHLSIIHTDKKNNRIGPLLQDPPKLIAKLQIDGYLLLINISYILYAHPNSEFILKFLTRLSNIRNVYSTDILYIIYHNNILNNKDADVKLINFTIDTLIKYKKNITKEEKFIKLDKEQRIAKGEHAYNQLWGNPYNTKIRQILINGELKRRKINKIIFLFNQLPLEEKRRLLLNQTFAVKWTTPIISKLEINDETFNDWFQVAKYNDFWSALTLFLKKYKAAKNKHVFTTGLEYLILESVVHNDIQPIFNSRYFELIKNTIGTMDFLKLIRSLLAEGTYSTQYKQPTIHLIEWIFNIINKEFKKKSAAIPLCKEILNSTIAENELYFVSFASFIFVECNNTFSIKNIHPDLLDTMTKLKIVFISYGYENVTNFLEKLNKEQFRIFLENSSKIKGLKYYLADIFNENRQDYFSIHCNKYLSPEEFVNYIYRNDVLFTETLALEKMNELFSPVQCLKLLPFCHDDLIYIGKHDIVRWMDKCHYPSTEIQKILDNCIPKIINRLDKKNNNLLIYFIDKLSKENLVTHIKNMTGLTPNNIREITKFFKITNDELIDILSTKNIWSSDCECYNFLDFLAQQLTAEVSNCFLYDYDHNYFRFKRILDSYGIFQYSSNYIIINHAFDIIKEFATIYKLSTSKSVETTENKKIKPGHLQNNGTQKIVTKMQMWNKEPRTESKQTADSTSNCEHIKDLSPPTPISPDTPKKTVIKMPMWSNKPNIETKQTLSSNWENSNNPSPPTPISPR